jgi:hypothetical protein
MSQNDANATQLVPQIGPPNPALERLDRLVGTWRLTGRSLGSQEDDIGGQVTIAWLPGGYFMEQRGEIEAGGFKGHALEIIGYDPATDTFPATVYSSMDGAPAAYFWDVRGDVVTHWTKGSRYKGTFSADGNTLVGGWRPVEGIEANAGNAYDASMTRVK